MVILSKKYPLFIFIIKMVISNINYKKLNIYEFNFIYTYISIL